MKEKFIIKRVSPSGNKSYLFAYSATMNYTSWTSECYAAARFDKYEVAQNTIPHIPGFIYQIEKIFVIT